MRVDDPAYKRPLLLGTTARELTTTEIRSAYAYRWLIETNFYVAQGTRAMEILRGWRETSVARRLSWRCWRARCSRLSPPRVTRCR